MPITAADAEAERRKAFLSELYGKDVRFDLASATGPDFLITPAGDWGTVEEDEALRQSLILEACEAPGEYTLLPGRVGGIRHLVKARNTQSVRDAAVLQLRRMALSNPRVASVEAVNVEVGDGGVVKFALYVWPKGKAKRDRALGVFGEVNS